MPVHEWKRVDHGAFHDFHLSWISALKARLNSGVLPPAYYALAEQRAGDTEPDVLTLRLQESSRGSPSTGSEYTPTRAEDDLTGAVALAEAVPEVAIVTDLDTNAYIQKRRSLVIRHVTDHEIVALIEIVSPGNKSGQHAFDQFLDKILSALDHGIHVLLVDLHPPTRRDPRGLHAAIAEAYGQEANGLNPAKPLTLASYLAGNLRRGFVQPFAVGDTLNSMPIFLDHAYYVRAPLEETYMAAWDTIPHHLQAKLSQ